MATVVINQVAVGAYMAAPDGPVGRLMMVVGEQVKVATLAGMNPQVRKFMGGQVVKRPVVTSTGLAVQVGVARTRTRAHPIDPHPPLKYLRWTGKDGKVIYARHVNHPGSEMGPYIAKLLVRALMLARV